MRFLFHGELNAPDVMRNRWGKIMRVWKSVVISGNNGPVIAREERGCDKMKIAGGGKNDYS